MTFRNAIQNKAMKLGSAKNALHIQEANKAALLATLSGMKGSGKVAEMKAAINNYRQPSVATPPRSVATPPRRDKTDIQDFTPEELADIMVSVIRASLDVIDRSTRDWASVSMVTGGTVHVPIAITHCGSIQPGTLITLPQRQAAELSKLELPRFAREFATGLIEGYAQSFTCWLSTLQLTGAPLFPVMGDNIPWRISELPNNITLISKSVMKVYMMSAGAKLPAPVGGGTPVLSEQALDYVAGIASGMLRFSISQSMLRNLTAMGGISPAPGAPVVNGVLVSSRGVFSDIGSNLPTQDEQAQFDGVAGPVGLALRQDMVSAAFRRAGAALPPSMPPT